VERSLTATRLAEVQAAMAELWLGEAAQSMLLGTVTLRPHQDEAVTRLRTVLAEHHAALLADDVGLGKTYVALAVAREYRAPVIVAPAALRAMWREALATAGVVARCLSYEQLSRGDVAGCAADLVVLDEAQHARTPSTQRYARLAAMAAGARLLLLSATPIHNRRDDLTALFALALGHGARSLTDAEIAVRTVRRTHRDVPSEPLPEVARREWIRVPDDGGVLHELLSLPPPLPPRGGGDGGALLVWTLLRLWASTRGALRAALRRRVQRGWALRQALEAGVHPSARELAAWQCSDHAVQLAFPELIAPPVASPAELLSALDRHLAAVDALRQRLTSGPDPDGARAEALRTLRADGPAERILVFTQFADSAAALWRLLRGDPGVAVLTSRGAEVAGGSITRREGLCRFAPLAHGTPAPAAAEAITMLISTDLLSEGVNLQDASTVVHLDLPWTHARLEQRVGRVRRMGSRHAAVRVFTFAPPAAAERVLAAERRITEKLGAAARTLGIAGAILPSVPHAPPDADTSPARALEQLRAAVGTWRQAQPATTRESTATPFACVSADRSGALVALRSASQPVTLAAWIHGRCSTDPHDVLAAVRAIEHATPRPPDESSARDACRRVEEWAHARAAERTAGGAISIQSAASRALLRRLSTIVAGTPRAQRQHAAALAARARRAAACPIGVGGELVLGRLAAAAMPDEAWLRAVAAFAEAHGAGDPQQHQGEPQTVVGALIVLTAPSRARAPVPDPR
jgi:hypothetical protein